MYAVIQTGGKQYRVEKGDLLQVELLEPGSDKVEFPDVFLVSNGQEALVGTPRVDGAKVTGTVVGTGRAPKVLVFKKKRRKHYKRTIGHRQYFTAVRIDDIDSGGAIKPLEKKAAAPTRKKTVKKTAGARATAKKTTVKATAGKTTKKTTKKAATGKAPAGARKTTARKTTTKKSSKKTGA